MSEQNTSLIRRYEEEVWNQRNIDTIDTLFSPDLVNHVPDSMPEMRGRAGLKRMFRLLRTACPDARYTLEVVVANNDKVAAAWALRGPHTGELAGIAPTGKSLTLMGTAIYRIENNQIAEIWGDADFYQVIQQLEAIAACATAFRTSQRERISAPYYETPSVDSIAD